MRNEPHHGVDATFILKLVFPINYCFCLNSHLSGCVVLIITVRFFTVIVTVALIFAIKIIITTITFAMRVILYCQYCR